MIITIIEHTVRQFEVADNNENDFDPFNDDTFIKELEVSGDTQEKYCSEGWEIAI